MHKNFLQTEEWRRFQESVGNKTFLLNDDVFVIKLPLPLQKSYLYSPHFQADSFLNEIQKISKKENAVFFKYEPLLEKEKLKEEEKERELMQNGFRKAVKQLQPQKTIILNLEKSEEDIMKEMHKKTRYNTRLAERKGVHVRLSNDKTKDFEKFWELLTKTSERDGFSTHNKYYYQRLLELDSVELYFAYLEKTLVASALMLYHEDSVVYLHGASDYKYRKFMAPNLLHWNIIKEAKQKGFREYDLWGIDEEAWPGVTRFKRGFGGKEIEYAGSFDYPFQKLWYKAYELKNKT